MTDAVPGVITRYPQASDGQRVKTLADCFTPDGRVLDEDTSYTGRDEIVGWREATAAKWVFDLDGGLISQLRTA
jgi:hypothetical protein